MPSLGQLFAVGDMVSDKALWAVAQTHDCVHVMQVVCGVIDVDREQGHINLSLDPKYLNKNIQPTDLVSVRDMAWVQHYCLHVL